MCVSAERDFANAFQQFAEGRITGETRPQHELIGEETDEWFNLAAIAIGYVCADNDVVLVASNGRAEP